MALMMPLGAAFCPGWSFTDVPLRIAQGAFERVPLIVFGQGRLVEGGERALVVLSNLDNRQIRFSKEDDDEASHTASKKCHPVMRCGIAFS